jgi:hypothetical protein
VLADRYPVLPAGSHRAARRLPAGSHEGANQNGDDSDQIFLLMPRVVIKSGEVLVEQGEIRKTLFEKTLPASPNSDTKSRNGHQKMVQCVSFNEAEKRSDESETSQ